MAFAAFLPVSIVGIQIGWGAAALGLAGLLAAGHRARPGPIDGALALHVAAVVGSILVSPWPGDPVERWNLWRLLAIPVLTGVLTFHPSLGRRVLWVSLGVAALIAPYAIAQYFTGIDWLRASGRTVRFAAAFAEDRWRPVGTFNLYSTFAFVYAALALLALARAWAVRDRLRWLALALAGPMAMAVGLTQVRAAWMALGAGVLAMAWLKSRRALVVSLAALTVAGGLAVATVPAIREKALSTFDLSYANNGDRVFMWARALEMTSDHPVAGIGHGGWTASTRWYFDRWDSRFPVRCHAHDNFLHFWATTGPLGLLAFLWMFTAFFRAAVPAWHRLREEAPEDAALALGAVGVVVAFGAYALTQDPFFDGEVFYVWVLALALGGAVARRAGSAPQRWPTAREALGAATPLALGYLAVQVEATAAAASRGPFWSAALLGGAALLVVWFAASSRRRALMLRDPLAWAAALGLALVSGLYLLVVGVLADPSGVSHLASTVGVRTALAGLSMVLGARLVLVSPHPTRPAWVLGGLAALGAALSLWRLAPPPANQDRDEDGAADLADGCHLFDPGQFDLDGDGVTDACEPLTSVQGRGRRALGTSASGQLLELTGTSSGAGHPLGRFAPYMDWTAVAEGPLGPEGADRIVLASGWARRLELLHPDGQRIPEALRLGDGWRDLAVVPTPSGAHQLLALGEAGRVERFDLSSDRFERLGRWQGTPPLTALATGPEGRIAATAMGDAPGQGRLLIIAPLDGAVLADHPLPFEGTDLVWTGSRSVLVAAPSGGLGLVDVVSGALRARGHLEGGVRLLLATSRGIFAYRRRDPALVPIEPLIDTGR